MTMQHSSGLDRNAARSVANGNIQQSFQLYNTSM